MKVIVETVIQLGSGTELKVYKTGSDPQKQLIELLKNTAKANYIYVDEETLDYDLEYKDDDILVEKDHAMLADEDEGITWHWNVMKVIE